MLDDAEQDFCYRRGRHMKQGVACVFS